MAEGEGSTEPDISDTTPMRNGGIQDGTTASASVQDEEDGEEDDEEEEPRLKYATVSKRLSSVYRNGDAISAFLVGGDKMIVGTHNGNIHALSLPSFQSLRVYRAHSASISAVSISPFPPPLPLPRTDNVNKLASETRPHSTRTFSGSSAKQQSPKPFAIAATPSNSIYIGTASIDGNICISSLVDAKDVQLRNFGRPVQAVALSPEYKSDRNYLSGGQAGSLILTTGGQAGKSANANLGGAAAAAQGWLGAVGLGSHSGTDKVLHSGEGVISTIKWSLSGKYVLWVNEHGMKLMRSNLHLNSAEVGSEWKRLSHIDRPSRQGWDDMAGVWKARAEWVNRGNLEMDDEPRTGTLQSNGKPLTSPKLDFEEVVVGWGDTVWLVRVHAGSIGTGTEAGERKIGRAEVTNILRVDCTIAGISLYTQNLLVVLAHTESAEDQPRKASPLSPMKKGRHQRHNALEPELRLIDINTKEEVSADTLTVSRYESLSASDYHLGVLPPMKLSLTINQRGALGVISSGLETIGQGVWDVSMYPGRLFTSGGSILSGRNSDEKGSSTKVSDVASGKVASPGHQPNQVNEVATSSGMKIFIISPYDCIVALKRDLADRLRWLHDMGRYQEAWELLDLHPEAVDSNTEPSEVSSPTTPSRSGSFMAGPGHRTNSLADFFTDANSISSPSKHDNINSAAEKEKRKMGELWLQKLITNKNWATAAEVASKVLNTSSRWEHWIWFFVRNDKFDEISPHVPTFEVTPPLPSLLYERILGHYVYSDRVRFKELLDLWPPTLFDAGSITTVVEEQLRDAFATPKESRDWHILQECLAKLYLASGRSSDALRCYIRLQDADTALALIKEHHLLSDVSDDIPGLILLRVSRSQLEHASVSELQDLTFEPIALLVDEAHHGTVQPDQVVHQLDKPSLHLFLYFYLRALWLGQGATTSADHQSTPKVGHSALSTNLIADEGKLLVEQFADTAVTLFANYERILLMDFLQTSTAYTFDAAVRVCESKRYISELVYLLAKTGQMKKALFLIIDELKDVVQAISFAKQQDDPDLWDDLLDYSMSRPRFIEGLLTEVGTAVDPIKLVKRIPSGLEVEGLRDGLKKMVREYDLQDSISVGVARVLQGEVAVGMDKLRKGRRRGIKFDVEAGGRKTRSRDLVVKGKDDVAVRSGDGVSSKPGHCAGCDAVFGEYESSPLIGFVCGHVYHAPHLLHPPPRHHRLSKSTSSPKSVRRPLSPPTPLSDPNEDFDMDLLSAPFTRSIGAKVTNARLLKMQIDEVGGCWVCKDKKEGHG
ncbi:hypothetical protein GJ744_006909 [Endocarpon pusillum]|uniref:Vps41 beta-propeller domain-containing protein n=1 Tax=Endocarpon pusillum TaxID=364733 RepID=A0A8H7AJF4_9EURO|nr:hypothetical protein GJ744_006909 [Endocarpon pusillum]